MVPKIVSAAIKSGIAAQDVQILAPMYRGQAGINNLNTIMQDLLNPKEKANQFAFNDIFFRKNDKILHLVNDTELNVFNGDIGIITDLIPGKYTESKQDEIYMSFDGNEVIYPRNEWNKITLAYAMSIHKSQGSEFPVVILPITRQSGRMLQRNLIYTAITRAKSKLVMLGEIAAFDYAVHNEGPKRNTYLIQRFEQTYTQAVDKSVEKNVKNEGTDAFNQTKTENNRPSETLENKDFSENINPSQALINTYSQPVDKSVNKPVQTEENYRLTEENWATIDPMIGLSEDDIAAFFNNN
ncbi:MAG: ATP-binding domain-containing protein [Streptococcus sp.]